MNLQSIEYLQMESIRLAYQVSLLPNMAYPLPEYKITIFHYQTVSSLPNFCQFGNENYQWATLFKTSIVTSLTTEKLHSGFIVK